MIDQLRRSTNDIKGWRMDHHGNRWTKVRTFACKNPFAETPTIGWPSPMLWKVLLLLLVDILIAAGQHHPDSGSGTHASCLCSVSQESSPVLSGSNLPSLHSKASKLRRTEVHSKPPPTPSSKSTSASASSCATPTSSQQPSKR